MRAGLMPKDELDMIINDMRPIMKAVQPGVPDTWDNLYAFFLNRVRDNLHVMLCFSPVGNKFSTRAQQFPGLINGCTIDWFLPWPEEALTSGESWPWNKSLAKQQQCARLCQPTQAGVRTWGVLAVLLLRGWVKGGLCLHQWLKSSTFLL
jgi:hypothetical protein